MKGMRVPNGHLCRIQGRRQARFARRGVLAALSLLAVCASVALSPGLPGEKAPVPSAPQPAPTNLPVLTTPQVQGSASAGSLVREIRIEKKDADWNLVLVNHQNAIPADYEINLIELPGGEKVDKRSYTPLMAMLEAARESNLDQLPIIASGYRTQETQQRLYEDKIAQYQSQGYSPGNAKQMAEQWVAVPGYSEHQVGLAVDINGAIYDLYFWLQENSYRYGFIFRYPRNKTDITGVAEEVWHYRYVGVEAATEMYEKGLCLEEYLAEKQEAKDGSRLRVRRMPSGARSVLPAA